VIQVFPRVGQKAGFFAHTPYRTRLAICFAFRKVNSGSLIDEYAAHPFFPVANDPIASKIPANQKPAIWG
jgi:hypothetical protein